VKSQVRLISDLGYQASVPGRSNFLDFIDALLDKPLDLMLKTGIINLKVFSR
jgi:hypothetical protein